MSASWILTRHAFLEKLFSAFGFPGTNSQPEVDKKSKSVSSEKLISHRSTQDEVDGNQLQLPLTMRRLFSLHLQCLRMWETAQCAVSKHALNYWGTRNWTRLNRDPNTFFGIVFWRKSVRQALSFTALKILLTSARSREMHSMACILQQLT